jgi:peptidoglycan/LPS O-acetylase OafA/YrhL
MHKRFAWLGCLRAFGVVLVLIYHFYPALLPGGFIGVDVFFVFSGFLITSLLVREFISEGRIGLAAFYVRRLLRLAPAVIGCVILTMCLSLLIPADYRVHIAQQVAAVLSWTTNYYEIASGASYADVLLPHLFVHTWTLAIEMQYYIVWGAVLFFVLPFTLMRLRSGKLSLERSRRILLLVTLVAALVSYLLMQIFLATQAAFSDPSPAYFNTLSHIYPLMLGSAAGIIVGYPRTATVRRLERMNPRLALAIVAICLLAITVLARIGSFNEPMAFNFGILATSLLCVVIIAVGRGMQESLRKLREPVILNWLAETSYSIYLFHWPLLVVFAAWARLVSVPLGAGAGMVISVIANTIALILTLIVAGFSHHFIEKPFASGGSGLTSLTAAIKTANGRIAAVVVSVVVVGICAAAFAFAPVINSMDASLRQGAVALQANSVKTAHQKLTALGELHMNSGAIYIGQGMQNNIESGTISMIGDSVAVFPGSVIAEKTGADVDVEEGRSMESGVPLILSKQANGNLGEIVVVALATNAHPPISGVAARELCEQLAPGHRLVFVTSHGVGDARMVTLSAELRALANEFSFVTIADWDKAIAEHEDWLSADGYHSDNAQAIDLYASVVISAIEAAKQRPLSGGA